MWKELFRIYRFNDYFASFFDYENGNIKIEFDRIPGFFKLKDGYVVDGMTYPAMGLERYNGILTKDMKEFGHASLYKQV